MPNYLRIIGKNRKEALDKVEKQLGHKNITILREGNIVNKKKRWFRTIEEKIYYIECVEYRKAQSSSTSKQSTYQDRDGMTFAPNGETFDTNNRGNRQLQQEVTKHFSFQSDLTTQPATSKLGSVHVDSNPLAELVNSITQRENKQSAQEINSKETFHKKHLSIPPLSSSPIKQDFNTEPIPMQSQGNQTAISESDKSISSNEHKKVYNFLVAREFTPKFARKITDYFDINILQNTEAYQRLAEHIASFFTCSGIVGVKKDQANFVFLVGPTGVGKTTTLSKIASSFYTDEEHYPKPALIKFGSLDAKRIMAMEQLRKFANILRVPFKSIYGVSDFKELFKSSKKKELVLVDTSGVSKQDTDLIDEIALFTNSIKTSKETHLCIGAQSRYLDLKKTYQVLAKTKPSRVIITKIDESYSLGSVLSFIEEIDLPLSYITNGQDVPIDIITASKEKIKQILLREWGL